MIILTKKRLKKNPAICICTQSENFMKQYLLYAVHPDFVLSNRLKKSQKALARNKWIKIFK